MKNIVTIGGGTGSYTVLSGLKTLRGASLTALVSMADNGGSTGVLRDELGVLPPGDVRQCLVALSEHSEIMRKLMNYRFQNGGLGGHNFGNIFLAALEKVTGNFAEGVRVASEIMKVNGRVLPITDDKADLMMTLSNKTTVEGEGLIDEAKFQHVDVEKVFYKNKVSLSPDAKEAILKADFIVIGPGDFYTSILPHFIVEGFKHAIQESRATIILPINLTNKQGHTMHWKASNYLREVESKIGRIIDVILVNDEKPTLLQVEQYKLEEGDGVMVEDDLTDTRTLRAPLLSHAIIETDSKDTVTRSFIRHDSNKLAAIIGALVNKKK
jgi:uncharacterized cofD-like protein